MARLPFHGSCRPRHRSEVRGWATATWGYQPGGPGYLPRPPPLVRPAPAAPAPPPREALLPGSSSDTKAISKNSSAGDRAHHGAGTDSTARADGGSKDASSSAQGTVSRCLIGHVAAGARRGGAARRFQHLRFLRHLDHQGDLARSTPTTRPTRTLSGTRSRRRALLHRQIGPNLKR